MNYRYKQFEDWYNQIENYGTRSERFMNQFDNFNEVEPWLRAAFECGRDEMSEREATLEDFESEMKRLYPDMYGDVYCGMWVGPGWIPVIRKLSATVDTYVRSANSRRQWLIDNKMTNDEDTPELIEYPRIAQIKEKFGELRIYIDGGDAYVRGLVSMAETWADTLCEECGEPGKRRHGGWVKTLCDKHEAERQEKMKARDVDY